MESVLPGAVGGLSVFAVGNASGSPDSPASTEAEGALENGLSLSDALDLHERILISGALSRSMGNVAEAARRLQTDRPNLYRRMRRLGIAPQNDDNV